MLQTAPSTADNVKASPHSYDSALTPFATRHGLSILDYYTKDLVRSIRFAKANSAWSNCEFFNLSRILLYNVKPLHEAIG